MNFSSIASDVYIHDSESENEHISLSSVSSMSENKMKAFEAYEKLEWIYK